MAQLSLGMARARLGPAAALIDADGGMVAACEENRLTRAVDSGTAGPPELAIAELLRFLGRMREDIARVRGVGEEGDMDAHTAHAAYALRASGLDAPLIVVCGREVSAWRTAAGRENPAAERITSADLPQFAPVFAALVQRLGFRPMRDEHLVEALARGGHEEAAAVQRTLGEQLLAFLERVKGQTRATTVCLSGGLFFNTYFTSVVAGSGLFDQVYVPPHPGRNGAAIGAALPSDAPVDVSSPYLGPSYSDQEIKSTLENCKLSFDLLHHDRLVDLVLHQLSRGRLVGWYHGRLEWGPRALGHRSVLADPFAPHVLENLNGFLKRRPAFRAYGVSVPATRLNEFFTVSSGAAVPPAMAASPFMQFEYRPRDAAKFKTILPPGVQTLRVHTVDDREPRFLRLLEQWGERSGTPVLVNTSFNGFHEPLVCSPRDAIRVFYGSGLDLLALENFLLRK
jgi:predicted NodU family carbamoyl transferase